MANILVQGNSCTSFAGTTAFPGSALVGSTYEGNTPRTVVCRYAFTTDAMGANALSFRTATAVCDVNGDSNSDDSIGRMRFALGTGEQTYVNYMGNAGYAITSFAYGQYVEGSLQYNFRPNTTYYLWIFPAANFHGMTRFHLGNCSISTSGAYGTPSSITVSGGSFGSSIPVTLANSVNGVTNTLTVSCGGITKILLSDSAATTVTWAPSLNEYGPALPNARSAQATFTCTTKYQGASWGSSSKTVTVSFPALAAPSISQLSLSPYNTGSAAAGLNLYVQGYSKARASVTAAGKYGASIVSYSLSIQGATVSAAASPLTSAVLGEEGSLTATVKVTDSRGLSTSRTGSLTVQPYAKPSLSRVSLSRCTSNGTASESGTYLRAFAQGNVASLSGQNSMSMSVSYKTVSGSYGTETAMSSGTAKILSGLNADVTYVARITLTDRLGNSATVTGTINSRKWAMKFRQGGTAVAFGKAPEADKVLEIPSNWRILRGTETAVFHNELYYAPNESYNSSINHVFTGILTSSAKALFFMVPLPKLLDASIISSATVTGLTAGIRHPAGGNLDGKADGYNWLEDSAYTVEALMAGGISRTVRVKLSKASAFQLGGAAAVNNTPVAVWGWIKILFT